MRPDHALLLDIAIAARKVLRFTHGVTFEEFVADEEKFHAVMYVVQNIGEAARRLSQESKDLVPDVPWQQIAGMRHRLVHDYANVEPARVWEVVQSDIPKLLAAIEPHLPDH